MRRSRLASCLLTGVVAFTASASEIHAAGAQDPALVKKGQEVYTTQKCAVCHSIGGKGAKTNPLDGVGTKLSADEIHAWITDPVMMTKKTGSEKKPAMPKNAKLTPADVDALVAYMQSLK